MSGLRYLEDCVTLALDPEKCTGCGMCAVVCPHGVFELRPAGKARKAGLADRGACMECGACARNCPETAITVQKGTGCASAVLKGAIRGTEPTCDCC